MKNVMNIALKYVTFVTIIAVVTALFSVAAMGREIYGIYGPSFLGLWAKRTLIHWAIFALFPGCCILIPLLEEEEKGKG